MVSGWSATVLFRVRAGDSARKLIGGEGDLFKKGKKKKKIFWPWAAVPERCLGGGGFFLRVVFEKSPLLGSGLTSVLVAGIENDWEREGVDWQGGCAWFAVDTL